MSWNTDHQFGELRSTLHQPMHVDLWREVCELLEQWPLGPLLELAIPYVNNHTKRWDDIQRPVPIAWLRQAMLGKINPRVQVCRVLDVRALRPHADDWGRLLVPEMTHHITHLYAAGCKLTTQACAHIIRPGLWPNLKVLELDDNPQMGHGGLMHIVNRVWPALRECSMSRCNAQVVHIWEFWEQRALPQVRALELQGTEMYFAGVYSTRHFEPPHHALEHLESIDLSWAKWDNEVFGLFTQWPMPSLKRLELTGCGITHPQLRTLDPAWLERMEHLGLNWNQLGDRWVQWLSDQRIPALQTLDVRRNGLTSTGLEVLLEHPAFAHVRHIYVAHNDTKGLRARLEQDPRFVLTEQRADAPQAPAS